MAYTGIDKEIYDSGTHFRPLQKYTQQQWTPPAIMGQNTNAGIAAIGGANPYKWPYPEGGGEGGADISGTQQGSWSPNQNLGPTNITDYEAEAAGVGSTWAGSWARAKDAYSKLPTPGNLIMKGIRKWKENREIKKAEAAAIEQARVDQISQQSQANAAAAGQVQRGGGAGDSSRSHMGGISQSQADAVGAANKDAGMSGWGLAQGGRIGLRPGGIVDAGKQYYGKEDWEIQQINKYGVSYPEFLENQYGKGLHQLDASEIALAVKAWDKFRAGQAQGGLIGYFDGGIAGLL